MRRIDGLEGMRGYMSLWVWLTHATTMASLAFDKHTGWGWILANGDTAVGTFIIISGFVIALNVDRSYDGYGSYIIRRALRLFPVYLTCLLISLVVLDYSIDVLKDIPWPGPRTADRIRYLTDSKDYFWQHLALHSLLLHGLVPDTLLPSTSLAFIGQAWSLTLEWQFYLAAPALFLVAKRVRLKFAPVAFTMAALLLLAMCFRQSSFLPSSLYLFFVGCLSYRLHSSLHESTSDRHPVRRRATWLLALLALMSLSRFSMGFGPVLWAAAFGALFLSEGPVHRAMTWALTNRLAAWLGAISYPFYCVHMIVLILLAGWLVHGIRIDSHAWFATLLIVGSLPLSLGAAWLLHRFIEMPMVALGRRLVKRHAPRPAPAS